WCLWLVGIAPDELRALSEVSKRVAAVKNHRLQSKRETTGALAATPTLFGEIRQPQVPYLLIPSVSSERRAYVPVGFMQPDTIASNLVLIVPGATHYHFGVLCSTMHMAWVRFVAGRLESRYRYSNQVVYNNFPWPEPPPDKQAKAIEAGANAVLAARAKYPNSSLADLYDPLSMPPELAKAHQALDRAVDATYGKRSFASDAERVAFLFELYHEYTSLLPVDAKPARKARSAKAKRG
ncbi:MAG: type IIL restriction-modification enzyme MmeI, partial [Burkholderiales bacterium]